MIAFKITQAMLNSYSKKHNGQPLKCARCKREVSVGEECIRSNGVHSFLYCVECAKKSKLKLNK